MLFSYNWLKDHLKYEISAPQLAQLLTRHSYNVEEVRQLGDDWVLDIEVMPNRAPDSYSHQGVAREANAIISFQQSLPLAARNSKKFKARKPRPKQDKLKESAVKAEDLVKVEIQDQEACGLYMAQVIEGVEVAPSPAWLKKRLKVLGVEPINNIVDITNFVMLDSGQPLHAFDLDKLSPAKQTPQNSKQSPQSRQITVRRAKKGEEIKALDGETYQLDPGVLVIADKQGPLAIAGIKGGQSAAITKDTKRVVLEAANFDSGVIYRGARQLGLQTDAARRFSNGVPVSLAEPALRQAACLIGQLAGGQAAQGQVQAGAKKPRSQDVVLNLGKVEDLLGFEVKEDVAKTALTALGFRVEARVERGLVFHVPAWRLDVKREEDAVEEVGRLIGYEQIPAEPPSVSLHLPEPNALWELRDSLARFLVAEGFEEVYNYFLTNRQAFQASGRSLELALSLVNPLSIRRQFVRPSLLPGLLEAAAQSAKFYQSFRLFEIGKVADVKGESWQAAGLVYGAQLPHHLVEHSREFLEAKGALERVLVEFGFDEVYFSPLERAPSLWQPGAVAEVRVGQESVGLVGQVAGSLAVQQPPKAAAAFSLEVEKLLSLLEAELEYEPIPKHPAVLRDLSLLVSMETKTSHILNVIQRVGGELVEDVELFDLYEGEKLPEGRKSLAFHIIYRHPQKTLTQQEVDKLHQKIEKALKKELKAVVR